MDSILIIDDEEILRKLLTRMLGLEGYQIFQADSCKSALNVLEQEHPQVVLCDVFLPDGNGVTFVPTIKRMYPNIEVVLLTAHGNIQDGVQAIKNGAFDYITKGDDNNKIIPLLSRAIEKAKGNVGANSSVDIPQLKYTFDNICSQSPQMLQIIALARKVAPTDVAVLLTGETGTGKEVFAEALHNASTRRNKPFLAINCSAFSKDLLESEIFGYKSGAFTGALKDKKGLFEVANGGTVFLDEIGEMAYELQAKLLRVLESGEYIKIGDTKTTKIDVRIISATNRDLKKEITQGHFREDLFYRLSVFNITLPPLRDRKEDIIPLANLFISQISKKLKKRIINIDSAFFDTLIGYSWNGNIRELKNVIERSIIVCDNILTVNDLPIEMYMATMTAQQDFDMASVERNHIIKVLQHTNGNKTEASRLLKIGLTTLYRKIEEYKITL